MKRTQSYKKEIRINGRRVTKRFTRLADADRWYAEKKREKELVESGLTPTAQETLLADYTATCGWPDAGSRANPWDHG